MESKIKIGVAGQCLALTALMLVSACSGVDSQGSSNEEVGTLEEPLFDATTIDGTAKLALPVAGGLSVLSAFDPLGTGRQVEFCGLIMKKANGTFHASTPVTTGQEKFCKATITPPAGSTIVGFYHSHTPVSVPGISPPDITEAERTGRKYYVVSTVTKCGQKYDPATNAKTSVGCFVF